MVYMFIIINIILFPERDAFDTLLDHAPDKLNVVKTVRTGLGRDKTRTYVQRN